MKWIGLKHIALTLAAVVIAVLVLGVGVWRNGCLAINMYPLAKETTMTMYRNIHDDVARARAIRHKYEDLFWRQPNVHAVGIGNIRDENGERTGIWGFVVHVSEKVDQHTLPRKDRIPACLEGVPVEIRVEPMGEIVLPGYREAQAEKEAIERNEER